MRVFKSLLTAINNTNAANIISMAKIIHVKDTNAELEGVRLLKAGSVIAVPTDTVYGLTCDATCITAINKLYEIKGRHENKPLAICLGEVEQVKDWAVVDHLPKGLLSALLPGPVTLILSCANKLDKSLNSRGKVGIRIPDYEFIRHLSIKLGKPLALTSANLSSQPSSVIIDEFKEIWCKLSAIFDGGHLGLNHSASTIIDLSNSGKYLILREGVALEETKRILKQFQLKNLY